VLVPGSAMDDEQVIMLRALGESYGRRVLVQNLRHVVVGLAGYRALWTDFLLVSSILEPAACRHSSSRGGASEGSSHVLAGATHRACIWMVKVVPEIAAYQDASVEGAYGKWVRVSDVLPMSDYDLEAYNTYRHQLLPSSEFDLQRHDSSLQVRYGATLDGAVTLDGRGYLI
jgi:hypothetical protein